MGRYSGLLLLAVSLLVPGSTITIGFGQESDGQVQTLRRPCRLVVEGTLEKAIDDGLDRSATLRRLCDDLAAARAVVAMEWGRTDAQSRAISRMQVHDEVVVAVVSIPPVSEAIELVAHELHHVVERTRGLDFDVESKRPASGVWQAFGGWETQAAIDAGRQVAREVRDSRRARSR